MKNFSLKLVVKRPAQEPRCRFRDNIKLDLKVNMLRGPVLVLTSSGECLEAENEYHGETFDTVRCTELLIG
jgi:hypothetical protein